MAGRGKRENGRPVLIRVVRVVVHAGQAAAPRLVQHEDRRIAGQVLLEQRRHQAAVAVRSPAFAEGYDDCDLLAGEIDGLCIRAGQRRKPERCRTYREREPAA